MASETDGVRGGKQGVSERDGETQSALSMLSETLRSFPRGGPYN